MEFVVLFTIFLSYDGNTNRTMMVMYHSHEAFLYPFDFIGVNRYFLQFFSHVIWPVSLCVFGFCVQSIHLSKELAAFQARHEVVESGPADVSGKCRRHERGWGGESTRGGISPSCKGGFGESSLRKFLN